SQQRCTATENRGQDRELYRGRRSQRIADPRFSEETRDLDSARLGSALHVAANSGISPLARLQRDRRFYFALALERELHSLRTGAFGESRLLLARDRDGSAAHLRARRNSRSLFPALSLLETRRPNSPALLRLGRERRHRILRRGNDVAGRFVRRQPTHARDHLQFYAFARTPRGSGREACTRPFQPRTSRKIFARENPHGRTNGAPGSDRLLHRPRPGHYLSGRQTSDHEISRRGTHAT